MSKRLSIKLVIYFIGFVLPILGMLNCSGFSLDYSVSECYIDIGFTRAYAVFYYSLITIAPLIYFIPYVIYIAIVVILAHVISRI